MGSKVDTDQMAYIEWILNQKVLVAAAARNRLAEVRLTGVYDDIWDASMAETRANNDVVYWRNQKAILEAEQSNG
jgi:hypothetical protein